MGAVNKVLLILITIFLPPVGVFLIAGCGADLLINICLTVLGYLPGHIHAFYLEYVYFQRQEQTVLGRVANRHATGVYSDRINNPGTSYGTVG